MGLFMVCGGNMAELDWINRALTFTNAEQIFEPWFHDVAGAGVGGIVGSIGSIQNYKHEREEPYLRCTGHGL